MYSPRLLATALLLGSFFLNATAIPTNITQDETPVEVTEDSLDGQTKDEEIASPVQVIVSVNETAKEENAPKEFKPSILIGEIPEPSRRKKSQGRILQNRRLPVYPPGLIRKFDKEVNEGDQTLSHPQGGYPSVLTLFNGGLGKEKDLENVSGPIPQGYAGLPLEAEQPHQRPQKLYYGDVSKLSGHQQGLEYRDQELPHGHHHQASVEQGKGNYYYPKHLMSKLPKKSVAASVEHEKIHAHPHHVEEHDSHHEHEHEHANGHGHGHGHGLGIAHGHGHGYASPHGHGHHSSGHDHYEEYRGHGLGHGVGHGHIHAHGFLHGHNHIAPVIGKALQILIPSALFITGASALFPTRIHVPTNDVPSSTVTVTRHKRSPQFQMEPSMHDEHDVIPSMYLRREHRTDDGEGFELYDDEDYLDPSATTSFGERTVPSDGSEIKQGTPSILLLHPPPPPVQEIPVIRINKLEPIKKENASDIFNFETYEASKATKTTPEPKKISTKPPQKFNSSVPSTTPTPTTRRMTPHEAMSQLLLASLATTFPTAVTAKLKVSSNSTPIPMTTTEAPPEALPTPQRRVMDVSFEASNNKPLFRPASTERPRTILTPAPKATPVYSRPAVTVSSKGIRREVTTVKPSILSTISSARIIEDRGPKIIELGGNITDPDNVSPFEELSPIKVLNETSNDINDDIDLAPDSPVVGLITNYAARDHESPQCQKRALCELAVRGATEQATKFERFLWNLASLVPPSLSVYYDLEDTFKAVVQKRCSQFICAHPNLDLQDPDA